MRRSVASTLAVALAPAFTLVAARAFAADVPVIRVDRDDVRISASCRLEFGDRPIIDGNGDGVIHVVGDGIVVDLGGGTLVGEAPGTKPWERTGMGIVVQGRNVTIRNGAVRGFHVGILATRSDGFTAEDLDLSGNRGARLRSTRAAEDGGDWLWPHHNDKSEWRTRYGAALCVERSSGCTIRRVRAVGGGGQNGIILDRVSDSVVHDNDCSFLSGWGLALWRSSGNVISRNAFDFCVRGYSHGVYNRGQDSAGILMFEQCLNNVIAENSATHGGDGIFIFAGVEALGPDLPEGARADDPAAVAAKGLGCNGNIIVGNDFSFAVAHGIEVTFSFDNILARNTLVGCGITGIWGGYSRRTIVMGNTFDGNGVHADNPGEEAGVSAEHAEDFAILDNAFRNQGVAIKLWWDDDPGLVRKAWAVANGHACAGNVVAWNRFGACGTALQVRDCSATLLWSNDFSGAARDVDADAASTLIRLQDPAVAARDDPALAGAPTRALSPRLDALDRLEKATARVTGDRRPVGARARLAGRDKIVMTEEGPYDWSRPLLVLESSAGDAHEWRVLGPTAVRGSQVRGRASLDLAPRSDDAIVRVRGTPGWVAPYQLRVSLEGESEPLTGDGVIVSAPWDARFFAWTIDPREDVEGWRRQAESGVRVALPAMDLRYGHGGPSQLAAPVSAPRGAPAADGADGSADGHETPVFIETLRKADLPQDRFGMIATTRLNFPPGRWRIRVLSDDGVRLRADGFTIIERWDRHAPTEDIAEIRTDEPREIALVLEHFELDGFAVLTFAVEPIPLDAP